MILSQKLENNYKNSIKNIKDMKNGHDRDMAIGALVVDIGGRCIKAVAKAIGSCFRKVKKCYKLFINRSEQLSLEFRGRKSITSHFPNLKNDIEKIIENYKNVDSHFKDERIYVSITPKAIIDELVKKYVYPPKFACYNTINKLLKEMGYILHKIPKTQILEKIPETDEIFSNVNEHLEDVKNTDNTVAAISIDDKAAKKIGNISDNGKTRLDIKALDHDTNFECTLKPFGILDLKTNETFVTCTEYNSTATFKVDCIEEYLKKKINENHIKKLKIFLDNGPENSGIRKLWLLKLVKLSIKYNIIIDLVYYPPYHSKYNKIERYWARLQMVWNKVIVDTKEKAIECINKTLWNGIHSKEILSNQVYEKGYQVNISETELIDSHIIREEGIEKWSIVITPFSSKE